MPNELNTDRLIGTLIERTEQMGRELHSISTKLDAITAHHESRVAMVEARVMALEMKWASTTGEKAGSNKMAAIVFTAAATVGGIVATLAGHVFKAFGNG